MKDSTAYILNSITMVCGLLVIYMGVTEPITYISIIVVIGGISLLLLGIMLVTTTMKPNRKLKEGEPRL